MNFFLLNLFPFDIVLFAECFIEVGQLKDYMARSRFSPLKLFVLVSYFIVPLCSPDRASSFSVFNVKLLFFVFKIPRINTNSIQSLSLIKLILKYIVSNILKVDLFNPENFLIV